MKQEISQQKLALLIDADNAQALVIDNLLSEVAKYGVASVKRAYGDWTTTKLKSWKEVLHQFAIQPVQQFSYTMGKNATDSALIIDAMDLLYTEKLDGFCIVSSDSDFTRLATRIRESGLMVYGFGETKTPKPFVAACDKFIYTEILREEEDDDDDEVVARQRKKSTKELKSDTRLVNLLRSAVDASADEDGWAYLGTVGINIANQSSDFDSRNYGYKKLGELIAATHLFEVEGRKTESSGPTQKYIRKKLRKVDSGKEKS